ncbi:MAG: sulfotransferase family 2 domain-containing protein [Acidobacteria bacterium]|nr:sulfotransferase family 2 domain-containing protein [Acidobacteriota bacterium]
MIISHRHQFIFFAVPKTATHAVRQALRAHLGETDEEQVQLFVQKTMPYPDIARIRHGHIRWNECQAAVTPLVWETYFKFAFVRNPWERFVSYCAFMYRQEQRFQHDPAGTMRAVLTGAEHRQRIVFQPQSDFLCDASGAIKIDFVGRHATLQADYETICKRIGIPAAELGLANASDHGPWRDYYDDDLKAGVAALYRRDIEIFGFTFD